MKYNKYEMNINELSYFAPKLYELPFVSWIF